MSKAALTIGPVDPRADDVRALLERHLAFAHETTPPEHIHALDAEGLVGPGVILYGMRRGDELVAIGALRRVDDERAELKSMHTLVTERRRGSGRLLLDYLIGVAREAGYRELYLETGTMDAFAAARSLYRSAGFEQCGPFGDYAESWTSFFMTLPL